MADKKIQTNDRLESRSSAPQIQHTAFPGGKETSGFPFPPGKRRTPIIIGAVVIAVLAIVLVVVGVMWVVDNATWVSTDDASIDAEKTNVSSKILGRVKAIHVPEGGEVKAGQTVITLDDTDLRAQEAQAAAQVESARVNRDGKAEDLKRAKVLYANGAITKQQFDAASSAYDAAAAQFSIAQAQLGVIEAQISNTVIVSPIDGTATKSAFSSGDVIQPSQTILTINNLQKVWVSANVEETKAGRFDRGSAVTITVDKYPGLTLYGTVTNISSSVLPAPFQIGEFTKTTRRIPVRIDFTSLPDDITLQPGLSVEVRIRVK